ncbi:MAG: MalY/PatB family protein [Candidatus Avoscillospira sp.]
MRYDFDTVVSRAENHAAKYDERVKNFGTDDVIPLWIADMDFKTAQPIIDALEKRAAEGMWGYTSRPASYFEAVCQWQQRRHNWLPDTKLCSHALGVIPAVGALVRLFAGDRDSILIQTPVYPEFAEISEYQGRKVLMNHMKEQSTGHWQVDWDDFEEKAALAKIFILCSPHNPLGMVWSREDLLWMMEICLKHHVLVISDEIHGDLVFRGTHIPTASLSPEIAANTITCISASKTFNLAGLHAATIVFPDREKKQVFDDFWMSFDIHRNNAFSLIAVETACREGDDWLDQLLVYLDGNFRFVRDYIDQHIPGIRTLLPDATYLMWLDCRGLGLSQAELVQFMIEKAKLGLSNGKNFDPALEGFMRLNAACPRSILVKAMEQLEQAVKELHM